MPVSIKTIAIGKTECHKEIFLYQNSLTENTLTSGVFLDCG